MGKSYQPPIYMQKRLKKMLPHLAAASIRLDIIRMLPFLPATEDARLKQLEDDLHDDILFIQSITAESERA